MAKVSTLVGDTEVATQIGTAVATIPKTKVIPITIPAGRMRGDVNGDGLINSADRYLLTNGDYYGKQISALYPDGDAPIDVLAYDLDNNGWINSGDMQKIAMSNPKVGTWGPELTGNWINNPNASSEIYQFYTNIAIDNIDENTKVCLIISGSTVESNYFIQSLEGEIRLFAKLCPIEEIDALVILSENISENIVIGGHDNYNNFIFKDAKEEQVVRSRLNIKDSYFILSNSFFFHNKKDSL